MTKPNKPVEIEGVTIDEPEGKILNLTHELTLITLEINKLSSGYVSSREKAQINNLIDKISNRAKLPNFVANVKSTDFILHYGKNEVGEEYVDCITVNLLQFLNAVNTEVPTADKDKLKKLEKTKLALSLLLEG